LERGALGELYVHLVSYESVRDLAKEGNLEDLSDRVLERCSRINGRHPNQEYP